MARDTESAKPVAILGELTKTLESAALECMAKPRKKTVHHLRTSTRRVEALLELFSILPDAPDGGKSKQKMLRLTQKLRRAAGRVRDLDVQRDLIDQETSSKRHPSAGLRKEAKQLRSALKQKRASEADSLVELLQKQEADLPLTLKDLSDSLKPAESISLREAELIEVVENWYSQHAAQPIHAPDDPDQLHTIRKQAKLARYLAESAPESAIRARRLAAKFEDLQQAGGDWHDWLLLAEVAADELGKSAGLVTRFNQNADRCLRAYKRKLEKFAPAAPVKIAA